MSESEDPRAEYAERRDRVVLDAERLQRSERRISNARLAVFAGGIVAAWFSFGVHWTPRSAVLPFLITFFALAVWHDRTIRRRERCERSAAWYERGLARIGDQWAGGGTTGDGFRDAHHAYSEDLDLFGSGSLFDLLCSARTPMGEATLAGWLCAPASISEIRERQQAVEALRSRLDLREDLAALADDSARRLAPEALLRWGSEAGEAPAFAARALLPVLCAATISALVAWILATGPGPLPFFVLLLVQSGLAFAMRRRTQSAVAGLDAAARSLDALGKLVARLSSEEFQDPLLARLRSTLTASDRSAAHEIASLARLSELYDARRNQLFLPIAAVLLWGTQLGLAIEAWRARCGPRLAAWLAAVGELEALCSLSAYAYEHPRDRFPEIVEDVPCFVAEGLGHPLIAETECVRNDANLDSEHPIRIVSGSNMSGKSTWLRAIGVAAAMAQAGAPVRARRLRLSPLSVGASLRIVDSLQAGTSHFYAEIQRLRQIVDLAGSERRLLFLLDEILHGTNSHDRRIGAEAIVRGLLERGALGLVTTHDLALAQIADELSPRVQNQHFADHLEDGRLRFDYRLRPGVVQRSNALALMREVGLDV